ncbi:hypothetical protein F4782DRAFT_242389 [Xylaria castorea]|nr:hypothetical protein F4782DRAFT_242389 [Xylaria castorea]
MIEKMGQEEFQRWVSLLPSSASPEDNTPGQQDEASAAVITAGRIVESPSLAVPDFVRVVRERYATGSWGFVVFDSVGYEMGDDVRQENRQRVEAQIRAPFEKYRDVDGVKDAAERFHLEWVQERAAESDVELVARTYGTGLEQSEFPKGLTHPSLCLHLNQQSLNSLRRSEVLGKGQVAFIQVVAPISTDEEYEENERQLAEEQDETYPTHFNVPLRSLLTDLFPVLGRQSLSLGELGGHLEHDEVWTSVGR